MKKIRIVHLDDHEIVVNAVNKCLIKSMPGVELEYIDFRDSDSAFEFISTSIKEDKAPDLIITDFLHIGVDGYQFGKMVRAFERKNKKQPIPIILLTVYGSSLAIIKKGLKEKKFNSCISLGDKNAIGLISDFINTNCQSGQPHPVVQGKRSLL